jgi:branched-chain amino acid transport system substrate-binding protein
VKKKLLLIPLALLLAISLVAIGCPSTPTTTPPTTTPPTTTTTTPPAEPILVGGIAPLTGIEALLGGERQWGWEKAVEDINAAGGVYVADEGIKRPLELIVVDDKSVVPEAAVAAEKLIKVNKVDFMFGTEATPGCLGVAGVAEKYGMPCLSTTFFPEAFLPNEYKWNALSFSSGVDMMADGIRPLDTVPEEERPKTFVIMTVDIPDGDFVGGQYKAVLEAKGYEVLLWELFPEGATDLSASILKIKAQNPDGIYWFGSAADGVTLLRQMKELDLNVKYLYTLKGMWGYDFARTVGDLADYVVYSAFWSEKLGYPGSEELQDRFKADFNGQTSAAVGNFYSMVQALVQAIETAGSIDPAKVRDVFYSGSFVAKDTTMGDLSFDNTAWAAWHDVELQWYQGERMLVVPDVTDWTLKWAPPWDER